MTKPEGPAACGPSPDRFRHLPPPMRLEDTVEVEETRPATDPESGRDTERDFMIRYGLP